MSWNKLFKASVGSAAVTGLCLLPSALKLTHYRRTTVNGVTTLAEAVASCQASGRSGWDLVEEAQRLVAHKFAIYSTRNLWDTPARAFAYGMGYCTQYNLALKQLLERLGLAVEAVFSFRVLVFDDPDWRMGHTWLRVTIDGDTRDVCAGQVTNRPGHNDFRPLWPVWHGSRPILLLTHLGLIPFCGVIEWWALLNGREPGWTFVRRQPPGAMTAATRG